ncbi:hypothetical protein AHF37_08834 [Paragonimus kellicotti]|nr:hypothetical protein AHF37_08834 [Paragonimus kellicotti]
MNNHVLEEKNGFVTRPEEKNYSGIEFYLLRMFVNPFRLSWTLIRLGHEPLSPVRFHSPLALLGLTTPIYVYPNILYYTYHIIRTHGLWTVLSTGVFASACIDFASEIFHRVFQRRSKVWQSWINLSPDDLNGNDVRTGQCDERPNDDSEESGGHRPSAFQVESQMERARPMVFVRMLIEAASLKVWEIFLTQPFLVVMVRQIASVIGGEMQYYWFPMAVISVCKENGFGGFFQGLVPRLLGELIATVAYFSACRFIRRGIVGLKRKRTASLSAAEVLIYFGLRNYVYPFELTGCIQSVRGAKLVAAAESNRFSDWRSLERHLTSSGQANRGWFPFFRSHVQPSHLPQVN